MLDQNTDRMWYVIGAIIIGGLILTSSIVLFTDVAFASVQDAFSMFSNVADVNEIPDYYVLATDDDFEWRTDPHVTSAGYRVDSEVDVGYYNYIGDDEYVIIPKSIKGNKLTNYIGMFKENISVKGVAGNYHGGVDSMRYMFLKSKFETCLRCR